MSQRKVAACSRAAKFLENPFPMDSLQRGFPGWSDYHGLPLFWLLGRSSSTTKCAADSLY